MMSLFKVFMFVGLACLALMQGSAASFNWNPKSFLKNARALPGQPAWIDSAVIYEITPNAFVRHGTFADITAKLPEIKKLGVNTLWLQPVYQTHRGGQGYDVTDYFAVRPDLGTEAQLADLIREAKRLHFRVIFDFVPNHTSIYHPYAQSCIAQGKRSPYYGYYQHINDGKPYSSFYQSDSSRFVCYFWNNLVNLDYNNIQTQDWMLKATRYWLQKYDLDGYRFDAVWGINARSPAFSRRLTTELKSIKPEILLLAEDKVSAKTVGAGFDAAYDWAPDTSWVSKWSWQTKHDLYKSFSIFNFKDTLKRKGLLEKALFESGSSRFTALRFIENNDVPRFIATHTLQQTKTAAALEFALPGIPMIYNGQEIGSRLHPYSGKAIFKRDTPILQADSLKLFSYYQMLIKLRLTNAALTGAGFREIALLANPYMVAFERWTATQRFLIIVNLRSRAGNAAFSIHDLPGSSGLATDVLTDQEFHLTPGEMQIPVGPDGIRWLLIKSHA